LLPNKKEIPDLLRTITKLGRESNLEFRLFSPRAERRKGFYLEIPVSIIVSGSYHNVAMFFDKVGRMDRIVNILNVSMKPVKALSTRLVTTCSAITFRFVPPKAKPKKRTKKKK
ncbi:MAG: type 4a pilus biogenesis protein PilO, partial [Thermodesulfobacteriota bacterium]|nr:type 4a pilus biogenesis protein PilO [Thermodesulfobacteriota bacterium]